MRGGERKRQREREEIKEERARTLHTPRKQKRPVLHLVEFFIHYSKINILSKLNMEFLQPLLGLFR